MGKYLPPPDDEIEFENLCLDLWREIWNDPNAQKYGRRGQKQKGIDIWGHPNQGTDKHAVQCKARKDKLSTKDIKDDANDAKSIKPLIKELTFATTAPRDIVTQDFVDDLSLQFQNENLFKINIWSWNDILDEILRRPFLIFKYFPEQVEAVLYGAELLSTQIDNPQYPAHHKQIIGKVLIESIKQIRDIEVVEGPKNATDASKTPSELHLDQIRTDLNSNKPTHALEKLEVYKEQYLSNSSNDEKFRYYYYLGDFYNETNNNKKCAEYFNLAYEYNPEHKISKKLKSLALLIEGNLEQATTYAQKAIEIDPCDEVAYQILVQTQPEKTIQEILSPIPEDQKEEAGVAFAIAEVYRRKGDLKNSLFWLDKALASSSDSYKIKTHLALLLFEIAFEQGELASIGLSTSEAESYIRRAIAFTDEVYESFKADTLLLKSKSYLILNKANAFRILREYENADKTFLELEQLGIEEDVETKRLKAVVAIESDNFSKAEQILKTISTEDKTLKDRVMLSEVLKFQKKYDEALALLPSELVNEGAPEVEEAIRLSILLLIDKQNEEKAINFIVDKLAQKRTIMRLVSLAIVQNSIGKRQQAIKTLKEAQKLINDNTLVKEKIDLALTWYDFERYDRSVQILTKLDIPRTDSLLTRKLLSSYFHSGQEDKALKLCQELRENNSKLNTYSADLEAQLYQYVGDFTHALDIYDQLLQAEPQNKQALIRRAIIWFNQDEFSKVDAFLEEPIIFDKEDRYGLVNNYIYLLKERGQIKKALELSYEMRRLHFNNPIAHLKYLGLYFEQGDEISALQKDEDFNLVSINKAVNITGKDSSVWFVIEDRTDADIRFKEINLNHSIAKEIMGKSRNQSISRERTIKLITSKYDYAYQESMDKYEDLFPDSNQMEKISLPEVADESGILSPLQPIFDKVDKHEKTIKQIEKTYQEGKLSLGVMAEFLGANPIKVWAGFQGNPNLKLSATSGSEEERIRATGYLRQQNVILAVDIIALLTMHELGIADKVKATYKNLTTCWSTVQILNEYILECRSTMKRGYLTIQKEGSTYVKYEVKPEDLEKQYHFLQEIAQWLKVNCDIQPVYELLDINRFSRQNIRKLIGESFFDTLLLARRENHILYTDDAKLRELAGNEYQIPGVWTQILISDLKFKNLINDEEYTNYILKLVHYGYDYISIDAIVLLETFRRTSWICTGSFEKICEILISDKTTVDSTLLVLSEFFFSLWRLNISVELKEAALIYTVAKVLHVATEIKKETLAEAFKRLINRKLPTIFNSEEIVVILLQGLIKARFSKIEFTKMQMLNLMNDWLRASTYKLQNIL